MSKEYSGKNTFKVFIRLVKIYYGAILSGIGSVGKKKKNKPENPALAKILRILKILLFTVVIFLYLGIFMGVMNYGLYSGLETMGMETTLFALNAIIISMFIFFAAVPSILAGYYTGKVEEQFLAMPIKPSVRLAAKIFSSYLLMAGISIVNFIILAIIFTMKAGMMPVLFYLWSLIVGFLLPIPVILIVYVFAILLMRFTKIFKNKNVVTVLGAIIGLAIGLGLQFFNVINSDSGSQMDFFNKFIQNNGIVPKISRWYLPVNLAYSGLSRPNKLFGILNIFALIAISFIGFWLVLKFMSKMFVQSLVGFEEKKVKKMQTGESATFINRKIKKRKLIYALFHREFFSMLREPVYLMNGPFLLILMPLILFVSLWVQIRSGNFSSDMLSIFAPFSWIVYSGLASLMGFIHSISPTAISRDAKFISTIKSMPVSIKKYVTAKFLHATFFTVVGILLSALIIKLILPFTLFDFLLGTFIALSFCSLLNCIGLFIDTIHPSLKWDTPTAAVKRNLNSVFEMLVGFAIMALLVFTILFFKFNLKLAISIFGLICLVLFIVLYYFYLKFAEKKFNQMEL